MRSIDDPAHLTPDQRLAEVASILAVGVLRLHIRAAIPDDAGQIPIRKSCRNPRAHALRFSTKPCSVSTTVNGFQDPKRRRDA